MEIDVKNLPHPKEIKDTRLIVTISKVPMIKSTKEFVRIVYMKKVRRE